MTPREKRLSAQANLQVQARDCGTMQERSGRTDTLLARSVAGVFQ